MSKRDRILFTDDDGAKKADPAKLAASPDLVTAMTSSNSRNGIAGTADRLPMAYRDGALDHLDLPSRIGRRLVYRDGTTREAA